MTTFFKCILAFVVLGINLFNFHSIASLSTNNSVDLTLKAIVKESFAQNEDPDPGDPCAFMAPETYLLDAYSFVDGEGCTWNYQEWDCGEPVCNSVGCEPGLTYDVDCPAGVN